MTATTIKLTVDAPDLQRLNSEAAALGIHRSALIRQRALGLSVAPSSPVKPVLTPDAYRSAVEAAARVVSGIPRVHLEALVSAVVVSLHSTADA